MVSEGFTFGLSYDTMPGVQHIAEEPGKTEAVTIKRCSLELGKADPHKELL